MRRAHLSGRSGVALDPVRRDPGAGATGPRPVARDHLPPRHGPQPGRSRQLVRRFRGSAAVQQALDDVHAHWRPVLGAVQVRTPGPGAEPAGQRLAGLPDAGLPPDGAQRPLPVGRRLRLPRPVAGRDGAGACAAAAAARAPAHLRQPPVRRGRRAALVASARGAGRAHAHLRRLPVAAAGAVPLRRSHHDTGVLDEQVPFLEGRPLGDAEESYYDLPGRSNHSASCTRMRRSRCGMACASARTACR
jgi:cyclic beta-1,2-glucan synthetase